jgi:hypothetical protein
MANSPKGFRGDAVAKGVRHEIHGVASRQGGTSPRSEIVRSPRFRKIMALTSLLLPWPLRRIFLIRVFKYKIARTARIRLAWVFPGCLVMEEHSRIDALTICKGLDVLHLAAYARLGRLNWITAFPSTSTAFFGHQVGRKPSLTLGEHSAITSRHLIDCTSPVSWEHLARSGAGGRKS